MCGEKQRDAGSAVVKVGAEADELENLRIAEPVEPDPRGARSAAYGIARQFRGDLAGFGPEILLFVAAPIGEFSSDGSATATDGALVFSRITSICQAISFSPRFCMRSRARAKPEAAAVCAVVPAASVITVPSLGEMKCGTLRASSASRSARCNGHNKSKSLSQSASRAMKSACADHAAPSSMLR